MIKTNTIHVNIRSILMLVLIMAQSVIALAQIQVQGTVSADVDKFPLPGVNVTVKGTTIGTITDIDGNYQISVSNTESVLQFSMVGMATQEIMVGNQKQINVLLKEDNIGLDEVVVVGYGTMKKADLTGSVGSIDTKNLVKRGTPNVLESMQGAVAGVSITQSGGRSASSGYDIQIRGKSSINSDVKPLYVVDGIIVGDIDFLNPQDIERIDILKDASSTAIYGSRATAGVVMVTTKSGKSVQGKSKETTVTYDAYYGLTKIARMPDFMDAQDFYNYRFSNFLTTGSMSAQPVYRMTPASFEQSLLLGTEGNLVMKDMLNNGESYDWPSLITQNGTEQNHFLTVSGSSEAVSYYFGAGYNTSTGTYQGDAQDRFNIKGSIDSKINDYFNAGLNFNLAHEKNEFASDDAIKFAFRANPYMIPYDDEGEFNIKPGNFEAMGTAGHQFSDFINPLYINDGETKESKGYRVLGNIYLEAKPIKNLSIKTTLSPNFNQKITGQYELGDDAVNPAGIFTEQESFDWTWDNIVNYNLTRGDHSFGAMGLYSMSYYGNEKYEMTVTDPIPETLWFNMKSGEISEYSSEYGENSLISYAARLNYGYKGKYMATVTARADGSSRFADGYRWGAFPSAAFAWRISEEEFLPMEWLSNLKLRLSYGVTGNNSGIGNYATHTTTEGPTYYAFGNEVAYGYYPSGVVNAALSWESSSELNLGFDYGLLNGRINGTFDVYDKVSKNLLYERSLPLVAGGGSDDEDEDGTSGSLIDNIGSVRNRGVELSLTSINISTKDLTWRTSFSFAANKNEVIEINGTSDFIIDSEDPVTASLFLNESVNNIYGYNWEGIVSDKMMTVPDNEAARSNGFTPGTEVIEADYYYAVYNWNEGMPIIEDINGDGAIDADNDKKVLGSQDPAWTGSLSSTLSYKNWDFSFSIYTKQNYMVYSNFLYEYYNYAYRGWNKLAVDYYIPAGTLIDADGVTADGVYINPVYQEQTHYGEYPFFNGTTSNYGAGNSWYSKENYNLAAMVDASYWKVKNISLGYTFDEVLINKVGIQDLRLYVNITNPFVFTKYKGFDPEWAGSESRYDGPSTVTYQFGVNLKF